MSRTRKRHRKTPFHPQDPPAGTRGTCRSRGSFTETRRPESPAIRRLVYPRPMISLAIGGCTYTSGMVSLSSRKAFAERASRLGGARRARSLRSGILPHQDSLAEHRATPERSLDQRMDALSRANEVRVLRAQLKRDLKAGRVSIGALLLDPPACLGAAKVFDMLLAVPKVGSVKATKILNSCRISPSKTFGGLSARQRAELAGRFDC